MSPPRSLQGDASTAAAVLSALRLADEHGGAAAALRANGVELPRAEQFAGLAEELEALTGCSASDGPAAEALALGFIAGRLAPQRRARTASDPTSFVMDGELVVQDAEGESILRLPWFEEGLFVGRQLPHIAEMPTPVRRQCVTHYTAALAGERSRFSFVSYGHAYRVDAVPVRDEEGHVGSVLAIATPTPSRAASAAYERMAARLELFAAAAEVRAESHRLAGRDEAQRAEREMIDRARHASRRAAVHARRLSPRKGNGAHEPLPVTPRELEVLQLASHGLTSGEIAEQLVLAVGTVKTHLRNIYPKLGVTDKAAAVAAALRHGLID